jgi:hypothetical protein
MKNLFVLITCFLIISSVSSQVIKRQAVLEGNNIRSYIWNTGVFNQDLRTNNTPGCEWPKDSGKFACFTSGLSIGAIVNGQLRVGNASYTGEYRPGESIEGQFYTDTRFKHYKVKRGDNYINNPSWLNWGLMVPYGAPFTDVNNNGTYDYFIDIPGFKGAAETIFICLTDGDSLTHTPSEGFGGGTKPLYSVVGLTAWCFDTLVYKDMQFFKWTIKNGSTQIWDSVNVSIVTDSDLGDASDDYQGCDIGRNLGYCYNSVNSDGDGSGRTYGMNPPAWGIRILECGFPLPVSSWVYFSGSGSPGPVCERDPNTALEGYYYSKGIKKDGTQWINITNNQITKFCFNGDPETSTGWTEYLGRIENCNGMLTGIQTIPVPPGDRRFVLSTQPPNQRLNPGESFTILAAQIVARGIDHKNAVTMLKQLSDSAKALCQNGFVIGINQLTNEFPTEFNLYQNYPNPFNPATKIKFSIPKSQFVTLKIYDALGREVSTLVNDRVAAGVYSVEWDAAAYPSGIYFYSINAGNFTQTRKMVMVK